MKTLFLWAVLAQPTPECLKRFEPQLATVVVAGSTTPFTTSISRGEIPKEVADLLVTATAAAPTYTPPVPDCYDVWVGRLDAKAIQVLKAGKPTKGSR